ncbi:hypothetical protein ABZX30_01460 [Streptomyces sp. NPDC004542]|uniref:hypothetical protein n=1 Tax=Streptomyces sp. NPDC004542 TaxID=3154281 RepID=UPI0033B9447E
MPASQPALPWRPPVSAGISMRDLLASCAAAETISRPPRAPEPERLEPAERHRDAA